MARGTGVGIVLVHGVVSRHNGSIEIESVFGKGTTFVFRFPTPDLQLQAVEETKTTALHGRIRVLVIDDEPAVREVVEECLNWMAIHLKWLPTGRKVWPGSRRVNTTLLLLIGQCRR